MKFILLSLTFEVIANNAQYKDATKLFTKFSDHYVKVSQIKEIQGDIQVYYPAYGNSKLLVDSWFCQIALNDNRVAIVNETCAKLMDRVNEAFTK